MPTTEERLARIADFLENCQVLDDLHDITRFSFAVEHTRISALATPEIQVGIADLLAGELSSILTDSGLHRLSQVKQEREGNTIQVSYNDDIYHFAAALNEHMFVVRRSSSTIEDFFKFYQTIASHFSPLYKPLCVNIGETSTP